MTFDRARRIGIVFLFSHSLSLSLVRFAEIIWRLCAFMLIQATPDFNYSDVSFSVQYERAHRKAFMPNKRFFYVDPNPQKWSLYLSYQGEACNFIRKKQNNEAYEVCPRICNEKDVKTKYDILNVDIRRDGVGKLKCIPPNPLFCCVQWFVINSTVWSFDEWNCAILFRELKCWNANGEAEFASKWVREFCVMDSMGGGYTICCHKNKNCDFTMIWVADVHQGNSLPVRGALATGRGIKRVKHFAQ